MTTFSPGDRVTCGDSAEGVVIDVYTQRFDVDEIHEYVVVDFGDGIPEDLPVDDVRWAL